MHQPGPEPQSRDVYRGERQNRPNRDEFQPHTRDAQRVAHVAREAGRERGGDARIHDEQAFPAVQERYSRPIGFAQVDVSPARFGRARRELAVTERAAQRHHTHEEPDDQQPER